MAIRVLYVEDNPATIKTMEKVLMMLDYEMISAADGESGIETAKNVQPDIILMDINLPGISGIEATQQIKADPQLAHIPVIAYTAETSLGHQLECSKAGCDAFIGKPGSINEIGDTIENLLT